MCHRYNNLFQLFALAGVKYEDARFNDEQWPKVKPSMSKFTVLKLCISFNSIDIRKAIILTSRSM